MCKEKEATISEVIFCYSCGSEKSDPLAIINMPRELGKTPKGETVVVDINQYGPLAKISSSNDKAKAEFRGLKPGQCPETITLEETLELFRLPRELGQTPEGEEVFANTGRFGPYIRYDSKFVTMKDVSDLQTLHEPVVHWRT